MAEPYQTYQPKPIVTAKGLIFLALIVGSLILGGLAALVNPLYLILGVVGLVVIFLMVKYDYFGLLVYLLVFLMRPGETYTFLAKVRIELILGACLAFLALIKNKYRYGHFTIPDNKLNLDMLLILGAMCLSFSLSSCKDCTINAIQELLKLAIFFLLIILTIDTRKKLEIFIWAFLLINAKLTFDINWGFYHGQAVYNQGLERATGGNSAMDNFNGIAITMNTMIPFAYYLFFYYREYWQKILMLGCLILFSWTLIITGSRGGLLGFLGILGIIWLQSKRKLALGLFFIVFMAAGWTMLGASSKARYETIFDKNLDESSENRVLAWEDGLEMAIIRPVTGVGAGAFAWARVERFGRYLNPHNMYIQVLAELGFIGAFIYFMFVIDIFRFNFRLLKSVPSRGSPLALLRPLSRAIIASCGSLLITGIFAHSAYRYTWYFVAALTVIAMQFVREMKAVEESSSAGNLAVSASGIDSGSKVNG
ncbi:membrane hypothetical protein [Candidatus Zixiibacteriota bacterium]|nr:membrane hypothetical protein [candidate division Zixibacteria bacterium]